MYLNLFLVGFSGELFGRNKKVGSHTGKGRLASALVFDGDAAFAFGSLEVTDKESAAALTSDIGDNAAGCSRRKAGCTLLGKDSGIDGTGHKSNAHEGDEEQLVEKHLEVQGFGL